MSTRPLRALATVPALGVVLLGLTRCELLVDLDRSEVDGRVADGCPICTDLTEGGEDSGEEGSVEAGSVDGGGDSTPGDGGGESPTTTDSDAGG
jgi:hypothetical protein